jgi:hypothetical protein
MSLHLGKDRPHGMGVNGAKILATLPLLFVLGCGSNVKTTGSGSLPQITSQPTSLSVPLGSSASFSVTAVGDANLTYQWLKDGTAVPGAIGSTYTIASTSATDNGSRFTVTVNDADGSSYSAVATLSIGPRSPMAGDLRFKQVDAASTINGYVGEEGSSIDLGLSVSFGNATGTPLSVGPSCPGSSSLSNACTWNFNISSLPAGQTGTTSSYAAIGFSDLDAELNTLSTPATVITGIDIESENSVAALSWMQSDSISGFDQTLVSVPEGSFLDAATEEGLRSRVITAVSLDAGVVTYLSYGWKTDTATSYETQVLESPIGTVGDAAQTLASNGYIITAVGGSPSRGVVLVGTRVKGDSLPRPLLVVPQLGDLTQLGAQGYAVVGMFYALDPNGNLIMDTWIGEK